MGVRRKAREMALQTLYAVDLAGLWKRDFSELLYERERWPSSATHARKILAGILENQEQIDKAIEAHADFWTVSRMNLVDRNILRIATYELIFCDDIPMKVSMNEALELGKLYGTPETKRFLNGILDKIGKTEGQRKGAGGVD